MSIVARRLPDAAEPIVRASEVSPPRLALSTRGPLIPSDAGPPIVLATPATLTLAVRELASEVEPLGSANTGRLPALNR